MRLLTSARLIAAVLTPLIAQAQSTEPSVPATQTSPAPQNPALKMRPDDSAQVGTYSIAPGTRILLSMINSVSTKQAQIGDRVYLETAFPVLSNDKIVIPQGSWVTGTVTEVKRPGRVKGRGELQVRFDSLTLPNGVNRDFRADLGSIDSRDQETLKKDEGAITGPGNGGKKTGVVVGAATTGAIIGAAVDRASAAKGAGIGAGVGAAAGLVGVLMTRGPEATLSKGSTVEMVLDRSLTYQESDLQFSNAPPRAAIGDGGPRTQRATGWTPRSPIP